MAKKTIKIFLDSNVILSGLFSETGPPRIILDILCAHIPGVSGVTGHYNLMEIERNIKKKMPQVYPVYEKYMPLLNLKIIPLPSSDDIQEHSGHVRDKDTPVIVSALHSGADYLVTGDKKDFGTLARSRSFTFRIVNPSEMLDIFGRYLGHTKNPRLLKREQE
ncbi:MAG: PIN domain-containing protein [Deltaproteobacteria bacterium]|nr:PIN domain-containing protein [Deltaproteobacteria bacterium]